jgi:hypothetical protein
MAKSKKGSRGVRESGARYKAKVGIVEGSRATTAAEGRRLRRADIRKLGELRAEIGAGIEALDRGRYIDVSDRDLERHVARLGTAALPRRR